MSDLAALEPVATVREAEGLTVPVEAADRAMAALRALQDRGMPACDAKQESTHA